MELETVMLVSGMKIVTGNQLFPFKLMKAESLESIYPVSGEEDPEARFLPLFSLRKSTERSIPFAGIARKLRLTFLGALSGGIEHESEPYEVEELEELDREVALISKNSVGGALESDRGDPLTCFKKGLRRLTFQGLECHRVPAAGNVMALFNISHLFKTFGYE